jgi:streptogramin lyase
VYCIPFTLDWLDNKGRHRRKPAGYRPVLENLEGRHLLSGITAGPDGNLWLASGLIRRFSLADGQFTDFHLSSPTSDALAITAGPDGNLWFTEADRSFTHFFDGKIGRITPDGTLTEFDIPTPHAMYPGSPGGITAGPDGNLWFTEPLGGKIGRITPDGTLTEIPLPTGSADPDGITAGPDGNLWFTEAFQFANGNKIGRITPDGTITEFPLPTPNSLGFTEEITAGPDGNLWFPEGQRDQIGRITPDGTITEFALPTPSFDPLRGPPGITAGPDGNVWFTEYNPSQIGQITPDGTITEFPVPDRSFPREITAGPDGNLWFANNIGNGIGEFVLNGGGGAGGLVRTAPPAQGPRAVNAAAAEALFAGTGRPVVEGVVNSQSSPVTRVDSTVATIAPEGVASAPTQQVVVDSDTLAHAHNGDPTMAFETTGLADPLAVSFVQVV